MEGVPSGRAPTIGAVYRAILICSEDDCTEVFEAYGSLEELEALACDCGCGLEVVGWPEPVEQAEDRRLELQPLGG